MVFWVVNNILDLKGSDKGLEQQSLGCQLNRMISCKHDECSHVTFSVPSRTPLHYHFNILNSWKTYRPHQREISLVVKSFHLQHLQQAIIVQAQQWTSVLTAAGWGCCWRPGPLLYVFGSGRGPQQHSGKVKAICRLNREGRERREEEERKSLIYQSLFSLRPTLHFTSSALGFHWLHSSPLWISPWTFANRC